MFGVAYIVSLRLSFVSLSQKIGSKSLNVSKISGIVSLPLIEKHGDVSREPLKFMFLWKEFFKENKAELSQELRLADVWAQALRTNERTDGHTLLWRCDGASKIHPVC